MKIWKQPASLEGLNSISQNTMLETLDIKYTEIGDDYLIASMPVDHRHVQPMRLLHGGGSVVLAESIGSTASLLCLEDITKKGVVGLEINANHLRPVKEGEMVFGKTTPIKIGRSIHVWNIEITNEQGKTTCVSRLTVAIIDRQ